MLILREKSGGRRIFMGLLFICFLATSLVVRTRLFAPLPTEVESSNLLSAASLKHGVIEQTPSPTVVPGVITGRGSLKGFAREVIGSGWKRDGQPELSDFAFWSDSYLNAPESERASLVSEGVEFATRRRELLRRLIREDPERALAAAVPLAVRSQLPTAVQDLLEERVSGRGELALLGVTPVAGKTTPQPVFRSALIGGKEYQAFTYGQRSQLATATEISINGIALEGELAVSDSPLRVLEQDETATGKTLKNVCAISGKSTEGTASEPFNSKESTAVEVFGEIHVLCETAHVPIYESNLLADEPGTNFAANGFAGTSGIAYRPTTGWTLGTKKILIIRVDFWDKPGEPVSYFAKQTITPAYAVSLFNKTNGVCDYYQQASFDQTQLSVSTSDVTDVLRMPQNGLYYATTGPQGSPVLLMSDARDVALNAGYAVDDYNRICIVSSTLALMPGSHFSFGGIADIGGRYCYINGAYQFAVLAHELGHTFGLRHANLWQVTDGNPISGLGTSKEYGDPYDVMGSGTNFQNHFSHWNKNILNWIPDSAVTTVSFSGTYRVFSFDHEKAKLTNTLALKVVRESIHDYWIGYRRGTTSASLNNGAYVVWGYSTNQQGNLLDLATTGTNALDAALAVGASFSDPTGQITIHPIAKGGTAPDEYLDILITLTNRPSTDRILTISTLAGGTGTSGSVNGFGTNALFNHPYGIAVDKSGNVYVADSDNYVIRKMATDGQITTLAGTVGSAGSADGPGNTATFKFPYGIGVDKNGNVYVTDTLNHTIRKISPLGAVSTLAGSAGTSGSKDGTGAGALFKFPYGLAVDATGNVFVADTSNHTIRKITPAGVVSTLAGLAGFTGDTNGAGGSTARFNNPRGVAVDTTGNVYVTDSSNQMIRKISPTGIVVWMGGSRETAGSSDGYGSLGKFNGPNGIAVDSSGNIYVADQFNQTIRKMSAIGVVSTLAGKTEELGWADGTGSEVRFNNPTGIAVDSSGNLYVSDAYNQTIRFGKQYIKPPPLQVRPGNKQVVLSWPASSGGFALQWATNLTGSAWQGFLSTPFVLNGQTFYTNKITVEKVFYRLKE